MSLSRRMLAAGIAASVALLGPVGALPSTATPRTAPITAPAAPQPSPVDAAAQFIIDQLTTDADGSSLGANPGNTADAIFLLTSSDGHTEQVDQIRAWLTAQAPSITDPILAAKVATALHQAGGDEAVIKTLTDRALAGMKDDGSVGWASAFTQAWPIIALAVTGQDVPQQMLDNLLTHQGDSGMFGYLEWGTTDWVDDPDGTAMAVFAMLAVRANPGSLDLDAVEVALPRTIAGAEQTRNPNGYWPGYSPVNSTGLLGAALRSAGVDVTDSIVWMNGQQQPDGGLPSVLNGTNSNVMATLQGGLILGVATDTPPVAQPPAEQPSAEAPPVGGHPVDEIPAGTPTPDPTGTPPADGQQPSNEPTTATRKPVGLPATGADR